MSAEIPHAIRERVVRGTVITTVFLAASSAGALAARELVRIRAEKRLRLEVEQSAADGNYVTTPEDVRLRSS